MPILDLAGAKAHLNIDTADTTDDVEIQQHVDAANEWVTGKTAAVVQETKTQVVTPFRGFLYLDNPVLTVTSIVSAYYPAGLTYDAAVVTAQSPEKQAGKLWLGYGYVPCYDLLVTYEAGRAFVPASVLLATKMFVKTLWETQRGAAQDALSADIGDVAADGGMGLAVWRAEKLLEQYQRPPAVA